MDIKHMPYDYRIIKNRLVNIEDIKYEDIKYEDIKYEDYIFNIKEVEYDGIGRILNWTTSPITPIGINLKTLKEDLDKMQNAFNKSVLEEYVDLDGKLKLKNKI